MIFGLCLLLKASALLTSEISSKILSLQEVRIVVEVTDFNLDVPKSSYTWNRLEDLDIINPELILSYRVFNESTYSNDTYWKLYDLFTGPKENLNTFPLIWKTFQVFLIHSNNYSLHDTFFFKDYQNFSYPKIETVKIVGSRIIIFLHPLENLDIEGVHNIFSGFFKDIGIFNQIGMFYTVVQQLLTKFEPITVIYIEAIDEDTRALYFERNSEFEALFNLILAKLEAMKFHMMFQNQEQFGLLVSYFHDLSMLSPWMDNLPEKIPTNTVHFTLATIILMHIFIFGNIMLNSLISKKKSS